MCAGCGLCQSFYGKENVKVSLSDNGFYRPKVINDSLNEKYDDLKSFCPATTVLKKIDKSTPKYDSLWGEIYSCFIGASADNIVRKEASSGGAISSILIYLLQSKLVDAVIHIGANNELPYVNDLKISFNSDEVISNANSRYSPSAPLINIHEILKNNQDKVFVFVGKPCDVAALRQLSESDELVRKKVKYYISFFCAGVPSVKATLDIVQAMSLDISNVKSIDYRKGGWPGFFTVIDNNKRDYRLSYSLTWMKLLGPNVQFRCKVCPDGVGHFADVVCADGWDTFNDMGFPTFKDSPGKSLVISRTQLGNNLINEAISSGALLRLKDIDNLRLIDKMQPGQLFKKQYHFVRKIATFFKTGFYLRSNSEFYLSSITTTSFSSQIKNFIGTFKRIRK